MPIIPMIINWYFPHIRVKWRSKMEGIVTIQAWVLLVVLITSHLIGVAIGFGIAVLILKKAMNSIKNLMGK